MAQALDKGSVVAVVGSGAMGTGIAQVAAAAGYTVVLFDARPEAVKASITGICNMYGKLAEKGKMTDEEVQAASDRLSGASTSWPN